jgi:hypothetical protein
VNPAVNEWVLINETKGTTQDGLYLSNDMLINIAQAVEIQLNADYSTECGEVIVSIRVSTKDDIKPTEQVYSYVDSFPSPALSGASAYHDTEGNGKVAAYCAISTCANAYGPSGIGVDTSHEILEAAGNPGCNQFVQDSSGAMHARERCDSVEVQSYPIKLKNGVSVYVSNFVLDSWFILGAPKPYTFMTKHSIDGAVGALDPPAPLETAESPNGRGNYQAIYEPGPDGKIQNVFANRDGRIVFGTVLCHGSPQKNSKVFHSSSRFSRIRNLQHLRCG